MNVLPMRDRLWFKRRLDDSIIASHAANVVSIYRKEKFPLVKSINLGDICQKITVKEKFSYILGSTKLLIVPSNLAGESSYPFLERVPATARVHTRISAGRDNIDVIGDDIGYLIFKWGYESKKEKVHMGRVYCVDWIKGEKNVIKLATGGEDGNIVIFEINSRKKKLKTKKKIQLGDWVIGCKWINSSSLVALTTKPEIIILQENGKKTASKCYDMCFPVAFSLLNLDGQYIAIILDFYENRLIFQPLSPPYCIDPNPSELLLNMSHPSSLFASEKYIAVGNTRQILVLDFSSYDPLLSLNIQTLRNPNLYPSPQPDATSFVAGCVAIMNNFLLVAKNNGYVDIFSLNVKPTVKKYNSEIKNVYWDDTQTSIFLYTSSNKWHRLNINGISPLNIQLTPRIFLFETIFDDFEIRTIKALNEIILSSTTPLLSKETISLSLQDYQKETILNVLKKLSLVSNSKLIRKYVNYIFSRHHYLSLKMFIKNNLYLTDAAVYFLYLHKKLSSSWDPYLATTIGILYSELSALLPPNYDPITLVSSNAPSIDKYDEMKDYFFFPCCSSKMELSKALQEIKTNKRCPSCGKEMLLPKNISLL